MIIKQSVKDVLCSGSILLSRARGGGKGRGRGRLIILMYHRVNPVNDLLGLSVSPDFFERQVAYLKQRYKIISLSDAVKMIVGETFNDEYVAITFDDGFHDNYEHAFPVLRKYEVPATIFVAVEGLETGHVGWYPFDDIILNADKESIDLSSFGLGSFSLRTQSQRELAVKRLHQELKERQNDMVRAVKKNVIETLSNGRSYPRVMLTWKEAAEMVDSGLVTIGSHTMTHPILSKISTEEIREEIRRSKSVIESKLGITVNLFAYPNGRNQDFNEEVVNMLKESGYQAACTTNSGCVAGRTDLFRLPRIDVTYGMCKGIGGRFSPEMFEVALTNSEMMGDK